MTTSVKVTVEGPFRVPVTQGNSSTYVSGKGLSGPKEVEYHIQDPKALKAAGLPPETITIGPEEPDNGVDGDDIS